MSLDIPDDRRTTDLFLNAMNSIMSFLSFTGECPSDFKNHRLPTLDCDLFPKNGQIFYSFFGKPMKADRSIDANTALPAITIKATLRQEIIRRLLNMHKDLPFCEKLLCSHNCSTCFN